jgi:hypothetical protein
MQVHEQGSGTGQSAVCFADGREYSQEGATVGMAVGVNEGLLKNVEGLSFLG